MKPIFSASDYQEIPTDDEVRGQLADIANTKLAEYLKREGLVVYGVINAGSSYASISTRQVPTDTHRAILINIEPIEKKQCEHKISLAAYWHFTEGTETSVNCLKCGVKLRARWEVAE